MTWQIVQKSAYLSDIIELNKDTHCAAIDGTKDLESDPLTPRGDAILKLP